MLKALLFTLLVLIVTPPAQRERIDPRPLEQALETALQSRYEVTDQTIILLDGKRIEFRQIPEGTTAIRILMRGRVILRMELETKK